MEKETKGIKAVIILEILGRPAEHLVQTLEGIIKKIGEEPKTSVKEKNIKEPQELKDKKDFYSTFAEVEIEVEDVLHLAVILFKYMPAHIEIIEPELIALTNNSWSEILSELARRLHSYDEVARVLQFQNSKLKEKVKELTDNEENLSNASPKESTEKKEDTSKENSDKKSKKNPGKK